MIQRGICLKNRFHSLLEQAIKTFVQTSVDEVLNMEAALESKVS